MAYDGCRVVTGWLQSSYKVVWSVASWPVCVVVVVTVRLVRGHLSRVAFVQVLGGHALFDGARELS